MTMSKSKQCTCGSSTVMIMRDIQVSYRADVMITPYLLNRREASVPTFDGAHEIIWQKHYCRCRWHQQKLTSWNDGVIQFEVEES